MRFKVFVLWTPKLLFLLLAKDFFVSPRNLSEGISIPHGDSVDFPYDYFN